MSTFAELKNREMKFRPSFGMMIQDLLRQRDDVVFVVADSSRACRMTVTEDIAPHVVECGIAEQNMIGVAAGLARGGKKPIAFAFSPFASQRCFEQIRLDVAYSNLDVVIVGSEAGVGMGTQGVTHYGWEDMAMMISLPNMTVLSPADHVEMQKCIESALKHRGPVYIRLTGGIPHSIYNEDYDFEIGKSIRLRDGSDAVIFATGTMVATALGAASILENDGISAAVVNMHTIKPLDKAAILEASKQASAIITLEEHSIINGLGSAVANVLAESRSGIRFTKLGLPDCYPSTVSPYAVMLEDYGLTPMAVASSVRETLA